MSSISFEYLNNVCEGDEGIRNEIIDAFNETVPLDLEILEDAFAKRERERFISQLHKIKTPILMVCIEDTKDYILKTEQDLKLGKSLEEIKDNILACIGMMETIIQELKRFRERSST
jgi:hypothetical protein